MTSPHTLDLPPVDALLDTVRVVALPMRVKFRGVTVRETAIFRGPAGWGEFGPFPEYQDAEASQRLRAGIEAAWQGFPAPVRESIPVNATVPAVPADRVGDVLAGYGGAVPAVKIKVAERGQSLADDVARVAAVRDLLPDAELRVDANMGWDQDQAVVALTELAVYDLEYAEQPVATIEGLAAVRQRLRDKSIDLKIAADESVRKVEDPLAVARAWAADLIIVKVAPLGECVEHLRSCRTRGCPPSSALRSTARWESARALPWPQRYLSCRTRAGWELCRSWKGTSPANRSNRRTASSPCETLPWTKACWMNSRSRGSDGTGGSTGSAGPTHTW